MIRRKQAINTQYGVHTHNGTTSTRAICFVNIIFQRDFMESKTFTELVSCNDRNKTKK